MGVRKDDGAPRVGNRAELAAALREQADQLEGLSSEDAAKVRERLDKLESGEPIIVDAFEVPGAEGDRRYRLEPDGTLTPATMILWKPEGSVAGWVLAHEPGDVERIELSEEEARRRYPEEFAQVVAYREAYRRAQEASPDGFRSRPW